MRLKDKNIVITGGASGIGLGVTMRGLREGAHVVIADRAESDGADQARTLTTRYGGRCQFIATDVTDTEQVEALMERAARDLGCVDVVFNNAGIGEVVCATLDYPDGDYLRVIDINLNGAFRVARAALRHMMARRSGNIVNSASIVGVMGRPNMAASSASKGGVLSLTRALALDAAPYGVRVNAVVPGFIDTPMIKTLPHNMRQTLAHQHPLGRLGTASEVANAVVFLASDEASFITGAHLMVDGGFSVGRD